MPIEAVFLSLDSYYVQFMRGVFTVENVDNYLWFASLILIDVQYDAILSDFCNT